jgi:hypothetical protein
MSPWLRSNFLGRRLALVSLLLLATVRGAGAAAQPPPAARTTPPTVPKDYFTRPGTSLNITPVLSDDDAYDAVIGPEGGTMITEGPDLTVYTLTIPRGALVEPTAIIMTPLRSAGGLPFARGLVAGVHLAPSGTWFMEPARLSIRPRQKLAAGIVTPFAYGGQGDDMYLTPYRVEGDSVVVFLDHFSGHGLTLSTPQEVALQMARIPLGVRERLSQWMAAVVAEAGRNPALAQSLGILEALELVGEVFRSQVLEPIRALAATNCTMGALYLVLTLSMERQLQLLSSAEGTNLRENVAALESPYVAGCLGEQYEQCLGTGDYRGIQMWYMGFQRQLQLLGRDTSPADKLEGKVNEMIRSCARYEVEFDSTLIMSSKLDATSFGLISAGPSSSSYAAKLESRVPVMLAAGSSAIMYTVGSADAEHDPAGVAGFGPLEYTRYELDGSGSSTVAMARDQKNSVLGFSNACTFKGASTRPGELTVLRVDPGFKNAENRRYPLVANTDTSARAQAIRILRQLPQVGLLAPPRLPDPEATRMWVSPKDVTELERHTCKASTGSATTEDTEATNWLDQWQRWQQEVPLPGLDGEGIWLAGGSPVMASLLSRAGWSSVTDRDARWHDSNTQRSQFGTTLIEATVILRHTPKRMAAGPTSPKH